MNKHIILAAATVVCVSTVWYIRSQNPNFTQAPYITVAVVAIALYAYYRSMNPVTRCVSDVNTPGSCELDTDCNAPNGQCWKNAEGVCGCVCSNGYSGPDCKTQGIPYDSPNCMGPNSQWTPGKDKNGMCVCPPGNWASGTDPKYGYVQCLKCAGNWGPLAGDAPCTYQWGQQNLLSNTCITDENNNEMGWCADFNNQVLNPPPGKSGQVKPLGKCGALNAPNSCRCSEHSARALCQINGWVDPNGTNQTCYDDNVPRKCSSYGCK